MLIFKSNGSLSDPVLLGFYPRPLPLHNIQVVSHGSALPLTVYACAPFALFTLIALSASSLVAAGCAR